MQLDEKNAELVEQKALLDQTQADKVFVEKNVEKLQLDLKSVMAQVTELEDLKIKLQQKDVELAQMTKSFEQQKALQNSDYDQKLNKLMVQLDEKNAELVEQKALLDQTQADKVFVEKNVEKLQLDLKSVMAQVTELEDLKIKLQQKDAELAQMTKSFEQQKALQSLDYDHKLAEMKQEIQKSELEIASKINALEKSEQTKKSIEIQMVQLQKQLTAISLDKYQLKKLHKELENQKLELMNTNRKLKSHQKNYDQVQLLLSEANQRLDEANLSLKEKDDALTKITTDKAVLEDKLAQLELDIKKEHLKATGETNQTAQKFLTKAYQEIEELHKEMRTQSENYEKLYDEVKAKNEEVDSLRSQLEAVRWKNQKTQNLTKDLINSKTQQKKCIMSETQEYQVGCI
ncbi:hypothetical protein GCM10023338_02930 [Wohlfahrtiimonas larvae]|uniref:Uncharacterized protein n=1 Tax=Wohlfahrtiimonas larvae TaxID=1157986 RepID=A0ABP9MDH5_9GAMM